MDENPKTEGLLIGMIRGVRPWLWLMAGVLIVLATAVRILLPGLNLTVRALPPLPPMSVFWIICLNEILQQLPLTVAGIVTIPLAIRLLRRAQRPATLALLGATMLLLTIICCACLLAYLHDRFRAGGWDPNQFVMASSAVHVGRFLGHGTGLALLVAAIFAGRTAGTAAPPATHF